MTNTTSVRDQFQYSKYESSETTEDRLCERVNGVLEDVGYPVHCTGANLHHAESIDLVGDPFAESSMTSTPHLDKLAAPVLDILRDELGLVPRAVMEQSTEYENGFQFRIWVTYIPEVKR